MFLEEDNMAILNVKDIFHDLHQIPEIGFQEFKTSAYLADKLRELGYRRINFLSHRYFMLYRIKGSLVIIDNIFHELQDFENMLT